MPNGEWRTKKYVQNISAKADAMTHKESERQRAMVREEMAGLEVQIKSKGATIRTWLERRRITYSRKDEAGLSLMIQQTEENRRNR